jgi:hypothetical protein
LPTVSCEAGVVLSRVPAALTVVGDPPPIAFSGFVAMIDLIGDSPEKFRRFE